MLLVLRGCDNENFIDSRSVSIIEFRSQIGNFFFFDKCPYSLNKTKKINK